MEKFKGKDLYKTRIRKQTINIEIDARKSTFKHILSNLDKIFKSYQVDRGKVIKRFREIYR